MMFSKWRSFFGMAAKFAPYVKKQLSRLVPSFILGFGYVLMGMIEPWPMKMIFDNVLLSQPMSPLFETMFGAVAKDPLILLNVLVAAIILIALVRGVFYYYQQLLAAKAGQQIVSKVRQDLYAHIHRLSLSFHNRRRTGDLLTHLTGDIRNLREMLISLPTICSREFLLMVGMAAVMLLVDWQLTLIALTVIPLTVLLLKRNQGLLKQEMKTQRDREGDLSTMASEVFGAIRVVQGFHQEPGELKRFRDQDKKSLDTGVRISRLLAKFRWLSDLTVALVTAGILAVAGKRVLEGVLSPGDILVFTYYLRAFNKPLKRVSKISEKLTKGIISGERILHVMSLEPEVQDSPNAFKAKPFKGEIVFENVSYMYKQGYPVLKDIYLKIRPGERVAVVGPTGSGKSTLVSLIPRFYDPSLGVVSIDGIDVRRYTLSSLRTQVSFVFQEPILFAASIAENIGYGKPDAELSEIKEAAEKVNIHRLIESLPEGYETMVGERGETLSGGERQCIAIARAVIRNAPIIILDEPTTGLDLDSRKLVLEALQVLLHQRTVILISHQEEPIRNVDRTITLHHGKIHKRSYVLSN